MYSGVYCVKNLQNNKLYIGQAINVPRRLYKHYRDLINNRHLNEHLQRSFNKYGKQNFEYSIVCAASVDQLDFVERATIYMFTSNDPRFGFNKTIGGEAPMKNKKHSDVTRKKISINHADVSGKNNPMFGCTGKNSPMYGRIGKNNPWFGKHLTEEQKHKLSIALTGRIFSDKHCRKIAEVKSKIFYKIIRPEGTIEIIKNLNQFCKDNNLNSSHMYDVARGRRKHHKNYRVEKV